MEKMITLVLVIIVLALQPPEKGTRQVGKLIGKELSVMKHIKNKENILKVEGGR